VLGHARLKVDGRVYEPVNEAAVPAWVLRRVAEARVSNCHHLVGALTGTAVAAEQRVPTVLAKVPGPERAARPRPWMLADAYRALRGTK
jgi:hypothetical protein